MSLSDDKHLDVCESIESGIKAQYEMDPELTDTMCVFALDNAKVAVKQQFGFSKNERIADVPAIKGIIEWCVSVGTDRIGKVNDLSLKEYLDRIEMIKRSVIRHSTYGARGYYEFIKKYV